MSVLVLKRRTVGAIGVLASAFGIAFGVTGGPTQQAKLVAADGAPGDLLGSAVAVSGDTAVLGAYNRNAGQGAVYVFTRAGTAWSQQQELVAADGSAGDQFGRSVAIDGDTAVACAPGKSNFLGAVYVFTRSGSTWSQQQELTFPNGTVDESYAGPVALDGDTLAVGAHGNDGGRGAAYVFVRSGTTWTLQQKLVVSDGAFNDFVGDSVALSGDTLVAGAEGRNAGLGAAFIFVRSGSTWTQQAELARPAGAVNDIFGSSAAVSGDTAVVCADYENTAQGAAYVFTRTGTTWTLQQRLTGNDLVNNDLFGVSASLQADTLLVGARNVQLGRGAAYLFARTGTVWTQTQILTASDAANFDDFGDSVALDGDTAVLGADGTNSADGGAYVFTGVGPAPAPTGYLLASKASAKANAKHPEKSTLTASGTLDTGPGAPDFSGAATFDVGGFHLAVPAFVAKGKTLTYAAGGVALTITPSKTASSHATFSASAVGDFAGKVDPNAPLAFHFQNAAHDLVGTATLAKGALAPHAVTSPTLWVVKAAATIKGGGKDAFTLTLGFATDGFAPIAAEDLTIGFGGTFTSTLAGGWVRKGAGYVHSAKAPGITKATIDYAKGTITVAASNVDLGAFVAGGNAVVVTATLGADVRTASIRMALAKTKLAY